MERNAHHKTKKELKKEEDNSDRLKGLVR